MNRTAWVVFVAALALALCPSEAAQAAPYRCPKSWYDVNLAVVHANGMLTDQRAAAGNLEALRPLVAARLHEDPYAIDFGLAYNYNEAFSEEVYNVVRERLIMTPTELMRELAGLLPMSSVLSEKLIHVAAEYEQAAFMDDADLERHVQSYRDHLRKGQKVIVIAHSEGCLYANAAYRRLFQTALPTPGEHSFGIVAVAEPSNKVAGWIPDGCGKLGCYTTLDEDLVIYAVSKLVTDTAPSNVSGGSQLGGAKSGFHGLQEAYLAAEPSRTQVLDQVAAFADAFGPLDAALHQAPITASLEWDTTADLDLHVYENDDSQHVYYQYPFGEVGALDADDADGYGPENYYGYCGHLEPGAMRFAVGYYAGEGPVEARLRVQAGNATRVFTHVLQAPTGNQSRTTPTTLGWLLTSDPRDRGDSIDYEFTLLSEE